MYYLKFATILKFKKKYLANYIIEAFKIRQNLVINDLLSDTYLL